jgi:hypothetical protein
MVLFSLWYYQLVALQHLWPVFFFCSSASWPDVDLMLTVAVNWAYLCCISWNKVKQNTRLEWWLHKYLNHMQVSALRLINRLHITYIATKWNKILNYMQESTLRFINRP